MDNTDNKIDNNHFNSCEKILDAKICNSKEGCFFSKTNKCKKKTKKNKIEFHISDEQPVFEDPDGEFELIIPKKRNITKKRISQESSVQKIDIQDSVIQDQTKISSACDEQKVIKNTLDKTRKEYDSKIKECEEELFGEFVSKYFNKGDDKLNHQDLLVGLQKYYIDEKSKDINFILSMQEFIQKFSQKTPVKGSNYKRQHVFEAICRILLFFNYDNGDLGINKQFYKSLEGYINGNKNKINDGILDMRINEGSGSGIVDIFFKSKKNDKDDNLWACETIYNLKREETEEEPKDEYIMIQNKYYEQEKSNISNYDVTRIYTLADRTKKEKQKFDGPTKIILMVNNGDAVSSNLIKAKQQYPGLLDTKNGIIGISMLDTWFQLMLYELFKSKTFSNFLLITKKEDKTNEIQLRFHQRFIIECTLKCIETKTSKFIWGAVPRSGKSYMIGGLISERFKQGSKNNIVIILGALTETLQQFKDMFKQFSNFSGYKIIVPESNKKSDEGNLNIYLLSQEWLKDKVSVTKLNKKIEPTTALFKENIKKKFPKLFENGEIDLYFDEVHKGGSTDISEGIIQSFNNSRVKIDIFVMVTATFAKPTLRYENVDFIGSGNNITETIEWSYNDQQNMKMLNDETKKTMIINTRNGIQQEVLNNIFTFYQEYYGSDYLNALSSEYKKHPELVLISPESINIQSSSDIIIPSTDDIRNVFLNNLQCSACEKSKEISFYINPANIFKKTEPVDSLLNFIGYHIYNYFKLTLNYPIDNTHTELWFLPDKHLYGTDTECKDICNPVVIDEHMDEDTEGNKSIPNIEPLTRGLSIKICQNKGFDRYNVLIVHNTKLTYLGSNINNKVIFEEFNYNPGNERIKLFDFQSKKQTSLSEQIKEFEKDSYKNGKSLIILTGAKLRLGISLPCADIAFNFDDIKSIDNNYQTMFRVLTERTKPELKRYGYYLDFNKKRSSQFIYEYNKIYGEAKKLQTKEALEALQSLLFTFNYNGLNLIKASTTDELNLYSKLINTLELNEEGYVKFWSSKNNIVNLIKKSLSSSGNLKLLQKLKSVLNSSTVINKKEKIRDILKDGKTRDILPFQVKHDTELDLEEEIDEEKIEESIAEDEDYGELINTIAEELPTIIALLAMFSIEDGYECNTIEECLQSNLRNISSLEEQCSCENIKNSSILDCFLNSPGLINKEYKYNKEALEKIIETLLELLSSRDSELLRNNLNFIFDNIKKLMTKSDGIIHDMTDKDIEEKIEQYLSVREEEKNKHGEVFTPVKLIEEMLDKLPQSVWSNHELKWLDPANGIGNFPMVAYQKLMKGLERWEPNKTKRSKHVIEKMLYMVEINPKNVKISKKIFGSKANICCANFETQTEKCFRQFGVDKFDVIIGNPPFQDEISETDKTIPRKGGKNKLYERITIQCLSLLNKNGYLLFVTPDNIMTGNTNKAYEEIIKYNTIYISFNNIQKRYFPKIGQSMCYFLVHISDKNDKIKTKVNNQHNNTIDIILKDRNINPVRDWTYDTEKIFSDYITSDKNDSVYYRGTTESDYKGGKYTVIYLPNRENIYLKTNNEKMAPGLGIKKIVLFETVPASNGILDYKGEYGVGPHTIYIPFNTNAEGKLLERFFKSNIYRKLVDSSQTSHRYLKVTLISHLNLDKILLKRVSKTKKNVTTDDIYSSESSSKTKKIHSQSLNKKQNKTKHHKKGGNKRTHKHIKSLFKFW